MSKLEIKDDTLISNDKYVVFPNLEFVDKNLAVISKNTTGSDTKLLKFVYLVESSKELKDLDDEQISVSKYSYNRPNHQIIQMNGVNDFALNKNQIILYTDLKIDGFIIPDKSGGNIRGRNIRGGSIDIVPSDTVYNIIMYPKSNVNVNDSKIIIKNYLEKLQKISKLDLIQLYSKLSAKHQEFFLELSKQFCVIDLK
jgi:hypothetical protein